MTISDAVSLRVARGYVRDRLDTGVACPCCTQFAKVYRRKITSPMARVLLLLYRSSGTAFVHVPTALVGERQLGGDPAKLRYWGLLEELEGEREDGSSRVGWWRVTEAGEAFALSHSTVPKYARVYDGRVLSYAGDRVSIREALGTKFDYSDLMAGR